MRIVTMNLWGLRGDWPARRGVLLAGLRELRPDLVAFQEAIFTETYDQARDLLGPSFHIAHQQAREPDGQGASIASRWPFGDVQELNLQVTPRTADFACVTLLAEIVAPDPFGELLFVNHLPSWQLNFEHERELQALRAAHAVEERVGQRSLHVVLAGDFTSDPDAANVRFFAGRQSLQGMSVCYRDAWESAQPGQPGHTFVPANPLVADWDWPFRRLDYIFVRCGAHGWPTLAIASCAVIFDTPVNGVWASDHFGVVADLALPARGAV
jgi:endonuclease/exonuclease/phosphatase family metal-dependent hydrolase